MSYKDKYIMNVKWAKLAEQESALNIAITRYYYAAFVKVLSDLKTKNIKVDIDTSSNQHNNTIRKYADEVIKRDTKQQSRNRIDFINNMNTLKRIRHKAEYEEADVSTDDVRDAKQAFKFVDSLIVV